MSNITNTPGTYNPNGVSDTEGLWISGNSSPGPETLGAGLSFGAIAGNQFITGIGFTTGSVASSSIRDDSSSNTSIQINGTHTNAIAVSGTDTNALTIAQGAGLVGIGTTTPVAPLTIAANLSGTPGTEILQMGNTSIPGQAWGMRLDASTADLVFDKELGNAWSEVARFQRATGNFGIGTSTPTSRLTVSGGTTIGADYDVAAPTNGLLVEGNVGIGTTSPMSMLALQSNSGPTIALSSGGGAITTLGGLNSFVLNTTGGNSIVFQQSGVDRLHITSSTGYVGIGVSLRWRPPCWDWLIDL